MANLLLQALVIANEEGDRFRSILDSTKAIFFFGTPHKGSDVADVAHKVLAIIRPSNARWIGLITGKGRLFRTKIIKDLRPGSEYLKNLRDSFVKRTRQIPCIVTFCETNSIRSYEVSTFYACPFAILVQSLPCLYRVMDTIGVKRNLPPRPE